VGILTFRGLRFPPSEAGFMPIRIPTLLFVNSLTGSNVLKIQKPPIGGLLYLQGLNKELTISLTIISLPSNQNAVFFQRFQAILVKLQ